MFCMYTIIIVMTSTLPVIHNRSFVHHFFIIFSSFLLLFRVTIYERESGIIAGPRPPRRTDYSYSSSNSREIKKRKVRNMMLIESGMLKIILEYTEYIHLHSTYYNMIYFLLLHYVQFVFIHAYNPLLLPLSRGKNSKGAWSP